MSVEHVQSVVAAIPSTPQGSACLHCASIALDVVGDPAMIPSGQGRVQLPGRTCASTDGGV